jgi:hypothetical protein
MDSICKEFEKDIVIQPKEEEEKPKEEEEKPKKKKQKQLLTVKQCASLKKNPNKNPITGKALNPNIPRGAYYYFMKECKEIMKALEQDAIPERETVPEREISDEEHKRIIRERLTNALKKALKPILNHKDSLENRVHYAKILRRYFGNVQSCIESSKDNPLKVTLREQTSKDLKEKIVFDKRIGSDSVYGTAYLNMGKGLSRVLRFSIKIMPTKFSDEVNLLKKMSRIAELGISPNMPITYSVLKCLSPNDPTLIRNPSANELMKKGKYYVVLNELANGDTHDFFKYNYDIQTYESIILQMIFSLRAFHNIGYVHNDAHLGNYLYHKILPGGFWQYQYKNTVIYVPNTGYLMVLWDPGMAKKENDTILERRIDYNRTLRLIQSIPNNKFYQDKKMIGIPSRIPLNNIIYANEFKDKDNVIKKIIDLLREKKPLFKSIYYKDAKTSTLPPNSKIINKKPYPL